MRSIRHHQWFTHLKKETELEERLDNEAQEIDDTILVATIDPQVEVNFKNKAYDYLSQDYRSN